MYSLAHLSVHLFWIIVKVLSAVDRNKGTHLKPCSVINAEVFLTNESII